MTTKPMKVRISGIRAGRIARKRPSTQRTTQPLMSMETTSVIRMFDASSWSRAAATARSSSTDRDGNPNPSPGR
jgi:hypothetical protein